MSAVAIPLSIHSKPPLSSGTTGAPWRWTTTGVLGTNRGLDAETSLVERCLAGEQGAWEELVKTHTRRVYSICYRFTNRDNEAQDLTQDVFLRIFKTLGSFRSGEGSFTVW